MAPSVRRPLDYRRTLLVYAGGAQSVCTVYPRGTVVCGVVGNATLEITESIPGT